MRPRWARGETSSSGEAAAATSTGERVAVVVGVAVLSLFALLGESPSEEASRSFDVPAAVVLAGTAVLLVAAPRFPATVTLTLQVVSVVWYTHYTSRLIDVPTIVAFYLLGTTGDRRRQLAMAGISITLLFFAVLDDPSDADLAAEGVGWVVAALLFGEVMRNRRLLVGHYAERAARAEAERDAEAERRVTQERMRIARDLHDVLAHTVSLMTVQAGVAVDALDHGGDGDAVRSALTTLRSAGKEAIAEVRATVAVLRAGDDAAAGTAPAPAPGLTRIGELVDAARARGLDVELDLDTAHVDADSLVELTAYRVVQESLTNVVRHADATQAAVRIGPSPTGLVVEVVDDGRARHHDDADDRLASSDPTAARNSGGFGLQGMTERVEAVGGVLACGPMPGRGWAVRATLPTHTGHTRESRT